MNKSELLTRINDHRNFNPERLQQVAHGKVLTNATLWQYLCELESWRPLEVVATQNPDWVIVASTAEIGSWHRTSVIHQSCDCLHSTYRTKPCCHLSAAMKAEESSWIAKANEYGFAVSLTDGKYQVKDNRTLVGELQFDDNKWVLFEPRRQGCSTYEGVHEAIEYLAAVASFGNQLA